MEGYLFIDFFLRSLVRKNFQQNQVMGKKICEKNNTEKIDIFQGFPRCLFCRSFSLICQIGPFPFKQIQKGENCFLIFLRILVQNLLLEKIWTKIF